MDEKTLDEIRKDGYCTIPDDNIICSGMLQDVPEWIREYYFRKGLKAGEQLIREQRTTGSLRFPRHSGV